MDVQGPAGEGQAERPAGRVGDAGRLNLAIRSQVSNICRGLNAATGQYSTVTTRRMKDSVRTSAPKSRPGAVLMMVELHIPWRLELCSFVASGHLPFELVLLEKQLPFRPARRHSSSNKSP